MKAASTLLLVTGIIEGVLGIPVLGGSIVMLSSYSVLGIMLILHIITLVFCAQHNKPIAGSILGIVTSLLAWIPILGMIMHIITAIILLMSYTKKTENPLPPVPPAPGSF